jgi:hypothetical protein
VAVRQGMEHFPYQRWKSKKPEGSRKKGDVAKRSDVFCRQIVHGLLFFA